MYYARPFTHSKGFDRLPLEFVPNESKDIHKKIRLYRNKVAAHSDSDHEYDGVSVNDVHFSSDGKRVTVEDRHLCPSDDFLAKVERLLDGVRSRLNDSVGRCLNSGPMSTTAYPPGIYHLRGDGKQDWSLVEAPSHGLDRDGSETD